MNDLFNIDRFMPHGHCFQWDPGILWTSIISDTLIAVSYMAIPFTLIFQIMRKRKDLPFNWMFICFGVFIVACGLTHVMEIITIWKPYYPISAIVKAVTAAASVPTAIILYRIAPKIVRLPSVHQLVHEQTLRLKAEAANEAKDRFIAVLSHELRTPLTPVKAGLDLLETELKQRDGSTAPEIEDALKMVRRNVEMETTLINDLLDVSIAARGQLDLNLDLVDFREVVEQSLALFQEEVRRKNIALDLRLSAEKTVVIGAAIRLHQVVNNLLSNAVKFTPEQGRIAVALENDRGWLRLSVHDNGSGVHADNLEKIFQPFEQAGRRGAKSRDGLGLGLTIARTIAESHKGTLSAQSDGIGKGTIFVFQLPLAEQQRSSSPPPRTERISIGQSDVTILLVDDHSDTLRTLAFLLGKAGYAVKTAETFEEAETLLARCDILVTDIGLPDGNGWDLMERFKERGGTRGIAITGFGQQEDIARSERVGFARHLIKPIDIDDLKAALHAFNQRNQNSPIPA